jgi:hypothetical protein
MRTALDHRHLSHHQPRWWVGHTMAAVVGAVAVLYAAAVLLTLLLRAGI